MPDAAQDWEFTRVEEYAIKQITEIQSLEENDQSASNSAKVEGKARKASQDIQVRTWRICKSDQ